jgi:hypothetical protein
MTAAPSIASAAIRRSTLLFRARLIHLHVSAAYFLAVESSDGLLRVIVVGHFDEGEAAWTTRFPVHRNVDNARKSPSVVLKSRFPTNKFFTVPSVFRRKLPDAFISILFVTRTMEHASFWWRMSAAVIIEFRMRDMEVCLGRMIGVRNQFPAESR